MKIKAKKKSRRNGGPLEHDEHIPTPAYIESLPNEILAAIFEAGVSISQCQLDTLPFQCGISGVNRHWRTVAVSTPRLWSTILFQSGTKSNLDHLYLWIDRSVPCGLDITIVVQPQLMFESNMALAIDRIILHVDRWQRLTIKDTPGNMVNSVLESFHTACAPRLQHFDLSVPYDYDHINRPYDNIFTGGAPALTSARIVGFCRVCTPPLVGLTALHFGGACRASGSIQLSHDEFRDLLTASSSLADLALEALNLRSSPVTSTSNVHIPSLRTLSLNFAYCEASFVQVFTLLSTPNLETLSLAHMTAKQAKVAFPTLLSETNAPKYPALHTLKLFRCSTFREYSDEPPDGFFSTFSSIAHLYLISTPNFILEPTISRQTNKIPWPNLRSVTILPKVLPDVIWTRKASGHPIATACVPHECLSSDEILWARIGEDVEVREVDDVSDSVQYPGGLDHCREEHLSSFNDYDSDDDLDRHDHDVYFESDGSVDSELLEYWGVCGSD